MNCSINLDNTIRVTETGEECLSTDGQANSQDQHLDNGLYEHEKLYKLYTNTKHAYIYIYIEQDTFYKHMVQ